jgi:hypothetical protein
MKEGPTMTTKIEALAAVLRAGLAYADEKIDDDEYGRVNKLADEVLGVEALEKLSQIVTSERWSPDDMGAAADKPDDLAVLLARIDGNNPTTTWLVTAGEHLVICVDEAQATNQMYGLQAANLDVTSFVVEGSRVDAIVAAATADAPSIVVTDLRVAAQPCESCGTEPGHHCKSWCALNGTAWDEVD